MPDNSTTAGGEHVCAVAIFLADGTAETQVLHRGSREDCEAVEALTPAVTYAGAKPVRHAKIVVRDASWWDALVEDVSSNGKP